MPNHVDHYAGLRGRDDLLDRIEREVVADRPGDGRCMDFNRLVPTPPHIRRDPVTVQEMAADEARFDRGEADGYEYWFYWSLRHWGTKWNAYDGGVERRPGELRLWFVTAWSSPVPVLAEPARRYPEVELVVEAREDQDSFALAGGSPAGSPELRLWEAPLDDDRPLPAGWPARVQRVALGASADDALAGLPLTALAL